MRCASTPPSSPLAVVTSSDRPKRRVRHSEDFLAIARHHFPPGGSSDGRPSFELFVAHPLAAADELFARSFDELPELAPGIRALVTIHTPFFSPIAFYAIAVVYGGDEEIEIISMTVDEDYWDLIHEDPE